ncbi:Acetyltransferase (isoleucine patch superfamily) [Chitinophaga niabensis]|uniref:Acetyltransferase (Isoleucine patch superfamily) n=1 Tax=Chitinophaga niabensis TaxID=536979 RepID=A0A1N6JXN7_9BACT|nr:Acetyltransferase (isoleucine patch superfamily) [Chitinophaga niabensis]
MKKYISLLKIYLAQSLLYKLLLYMRNYPGIDIHPSADIFSKGGILVATSGNSIGKNSSLFLSANSQIFLGEKVWIGNNILIEPLEDCAIILQDGSSIQDGCRLIGDISVGRNVLFAPYVFVSSGNHFFSVQPHLPIRLQDKLVNEHDEYSSLRSKKISIEDDCWIGTHAVIMQGLTIGKGSVIGANSVVTKDVPPYSIVGGIPAKVIKKRLDFSPPASIKAEINMHLPYFYSGCKVSQAGPSNSTDVPVDIKLDKAFTLSLTSVQNNSYIYIVIFASDNIQDLSLNYEKHSMLVKHGKNRYQFPLTMGRNTSDTIFKFSFSGGNGLLHWENYSISILEAGVI